MKKAVLTRVNPLAKITPRRHPEEVPKRRPMDVPYGPLCNTKGPPLPTS